MKSDGAGRFRIYWQLMLPLAKPILATIGIMAAVTYWNDWTNSLYYITDSKLHSVQQLLNVMNNNSLFMANNSASGGGSTLIDYEHFAWMLCNGGSYNGHRLLKPETVALMHTEAPTALLEPEPGFAWGLGVKIRQDPARGGSFATEGTYGWSGFGTHFFVSHKDKLDCVRMVNRSDLNSAGSYISNKVEEMVFGLFAD